MLDPEDEGEGVGRAVGVLTAILLFVSVSTFGGFVLTGVVEEKTSAVVEVLLARVPAHILLAGKVLGIGVVALVQLVVAVAAGVVALAISGVVVPSEVWLSLPTTLVWFTAGFALYSTLFALAGSFVSRQEDAQAAAAPITMCFMAAYLLVFTAGASPDSTLAQVLSLLPPFAPLLMPLRIASGAASLVGGAGGGCLARRDRVAGAACRGQRVRPHPAAPGLAHHVEGSAAPPGVVRPALAVSGRTPSPGTPAPTRRPS